MRYFDVQNHCCSKCGMLMTYESFREHTETECFWTELEKLKVEKMVKEFKGTECIP